MSSTTFTRPYKRPEEMSLDELRATCEANETAFYRERAESDPTSEQARNDWQEHCLLKGLDPKTGRKSRFVTMSKEEIGAEWEAAGKKQADADLDDYRGHQSKIWLASQPAYEATPKNAQAIEKEVNRLGLRGSVYDIEQAFWNCVRSGQIIPKEIIEPVALPNKEEAYDMPLNELKPLAEQTSR